MLNQCLASFTRDYNLRLKLFRWLFILLASFNPCGFIANAYPLTEHCEDMKNVKAKVEPDFGYRGGPERTTKIWILPVRSVDTVRWRETLDNLRRRINVESAPYATCLWKDSSIKCTYKDGRISTEKFTHGLNDDFQVTLTTENGLKVSLYPEKILNQVSCKTRNRNLWQVGKVRPWNSDISAFPYIYYGYSDTYFPDKDFILFVNPADDINNYRF